MLAFLSSRPDWTAEEIIGKHIILKVRHPQGSVGDLYGKTTKEIETMGTPKGEVIRQEVDWPKQTVFRNLKTLIKKEHVEKIPEKARLSFLFYPKNHGVRGRPAVRYRLNPKKRLVLKVPVKRIGRVWFPATIHRKAYSGTEFPVVRGKWKKDYEEHRSWLKEHEPEQYEKLLKLEREKKHPNRRPTARTKN